jgi:muconate cycloisomerase
VRLDSIAIHCGRVGYWTAIACEAYDHFDMAIIELRSGAHQGWGEVIVDDEASMAVLKEMAGGLLERELAGPSSALPDRHEKRHHGDVRACREGLSMALYDLFGRAHGVPVAVLLGGARRKRVPLMPCVTLAPGEAMERRAADWKRAGYRHLKVKLHGSAEEDLENFERIRRTVGPEVELTVDANSSYTDVETAVRVVQALERLGVTVVEDICGEDLDDYAAIRSRVKAKVMLDRHAYWPNTLEVFRRGAADAVNLHPRNVGGLDVALWMAAAARACGAESRMGAPHVVGIGSAAWQILGGVAATTMPVEDLGPLRYESHFGAPGEHYPVDEKKMVVRSLFPVENGEVILPDAPGLGVEVDRERLAAITTEVLAVG